jgi:DNA-binding transcriptional LysR family regulator
MDRIEAMTYLVEAVESGSFTAAGRNLGVPLPTISRKVAELENHLKTRLLLRSTRKLTLTDTGVVYYQNAKTILEQIAESERQAAGEYRAPKGDLVVTAPIVLGRMHLLPIINEFLALYPDVRIRLRLSDTTLSMHEEAMDVALRVGVLPDSSLVAAQVGTVCRVVCGSPGYFDSHGTPRSPQELSGHACVTFEAVSAGQAWTFTSRNGRTAESVSVTPRLSVNTAEAAIDAAISGVGLTHVLSYQVASTVEDGQLRLCLRDFEPEPVPVHVVHTGQKPLPLKTRSFIEYVVPRMREILLGDKDRLRAGGVPVAQAQLPGQHLAQRPREMPPERTV